MVDRAYFLDMDNMRNAPLAANTERQTPFMVFNITCFCFSKPLALCRLQPARTKRTVLTKFKHVALFTISTAKNGVLRDHFLWVVLVN